MNIDTYSRLCEKQGIGRFSPARHSVRPGDLLKEGRGGSPVQRTVGDGLSNPASIESARPRIRLLGASAHDCLCWHERSVRRCETDSTTAEEKAAQRLRSSCEALATCLLSGQRPSRESGTWHNSCSLFSAISLAQSSALIPPLAFGSAWRQWHCSLNWSSRIGSFSRRRCIAVCL